LSFSEVWGEIRLFSVKQGEEEEKRAGRGTGALSTYRSRCQEMQVSPSCSLLRPRVPCGSLWTAADGKLLIRAGRFPVVPSMIPNIGPMEIAIVLVIALVVFGPKRLPELGKSVGNGLKEFKSSLSDSDTAIEGPVDRPEVTAEAQSTKA
jgi:sec-independent protein translocase protein TatA